MQKTDSSHDNASIPDQFPDYVTKINSTVSGFVTNENNAPVMGADVKCGSETSITDQYGYFEFKNVQVVKDAATVAVSYPGYFKCIKTYKATQNKKNFLRIKLLLRKTIGNINASDGGLVISPQGLQVTFPGNAIKNASTGAAYSGVVTVAAAWLDPTSSELHKIMPGDLRGINTNGVVKGLTSYGMAAVELTGTSGEMLQIADGKKAILSFPLPASSVASAPTTIPLWYFDEVSGFWKEEGTAVKAGSSYSAEVSHFTFWNCDMPATFVNLQASILSASGKPLSNVLVKLTDLSNTINSAGSYTSDEGFVSGRVLINTNIKLEVLLEGQNCTPFFTKEISASNGDIALGNIVLPADANIAEVKGTVQTCTNNPVLNGYMLVKYGNGYSKQFFNSGAYDFATPICDDNVILTLLAVDLTAGMQSNMINKNVQKGENIVADIHACALSTYEYFAYSIDGRVPVVLTDVGGSAGYDRYGNVTSFSVLSGCCSSLSNFGIAGDTTLGIHASSSTVQIWDLPYGYQSNTSFPINVTEYGRVGEFISGRYESIPFTGGAGNTLTQHAVSVNFRLRRTY
ncbi:MAG: carboxypeptidase regulatory-like domain-containing protein [Chitinophagaceae bacterium]|nr:carboxypeptidase regulatory-like domain-containing protein [Chitinophagaceae bacterium]